MRQWREDSEMNLCEALAANLSSESCRCPVFQPSAHLSAEASVSFFITAMPSSPWFLHKG